MRNILILIALFCMYSNLSKGQCGTLKVGPSFSNFPDTITNLPVAIVGKNYQSNIQFYYANPVQITAISGLPSGFTYTTNYLNPNNSGCISIQSSNVTAQTGIYTLSIEGLMNISGIGNTPFKINGYKINICIKGDKKAFNSSNWYSLTDWLQNSIPQDMFYVWQIMKDSLAKDLNINSPTSIDTNYVWGISAGSIIDAADRLIDNSATPLIKAGKSDSLSLDSIFFPFVYNRNTDSILINNKKKLVIDTIFVNWYTNNQITKYKNNNFIYAIPKIGDWDSINLYQKNYFKRDTILLTKATDTIISGAEVFFLKLLAPKGMYANQTDTSKLFGFSINFRSGVSAIDTGNLSINGITTIVDSIINLKNKYRQNIIYDLNYVDQNSLDLTTNSYSGSIFALNSTSYKKMYGWLGYVPTNAWNNYKRYEVSSFKISKFSISEWSVSDTIICKGKSIAFTTSNCSLYRDSFLIGSGNLYQKPLKNTTYQIKQNGNIIQTINIIVIDSLNLQAISNSDSLKICGKNTKFTLGANTSYTKAKNIFWYLNDSLKSNTNLIDTFVNDGVYKLVVSTPTGCYNEHLFYVNKINSVFNPDFSSNKQVMTSPPFDLTFANQTQPLADYKYTWHWGDGSIDSNNNQILFKSYSNNGQYSVKLIAQNKQTFCKDSIVKTNYITCSGKTVQPLSMSLSKTKPTCFGSNNGSISVTANGGVLPYQYRINGGQFQNGNLFSNLTAGNYLIEVKDAANNTTSLNDSIENPALLKAGPISGLKNVLPNGTQTYTCPNQTNTNYNWVVGNGNILTGNGSNSIQVQWQGIGAGSVKVTVDQNNCFSSDSIQITIQNNPFNFSVIKQNETCAGDANGSITIIAQGGTAPYQYALNQNSYQLSNSFNNLSAGNYLIRVKDSQNDSIFKMDTLFSKPKPSIGNITGPVTANPLDVQTFIIGQQIGANYLWNVLGGVIASGQNTNIVQVAWGAQASTGNVNVKVTNTDGCSDSAGLSVKVGSVGLTDKELSNLFSIYPNPSNGKFRIESKGNNKISQLVIFNHLGEKVFEENCQSASQTNIDIGFKASAGVYLLKVHLEDHREIYKSLSIE